MPEATSEQKPHASALPPECAMISEKQFLRDHTFYSAISSWLFAIAGATNIGVLCAFSSKVLSAAEKGEPISKSLSNKKYNRIALAMTAFGAACMAISNWLESKKVVTEWQLGAGKLQRKANIVEREHAQAAATDKTPESDTVKEASPCKHWAASVQPKSPDLMERVASAAGRR